MSYANRANIWTNEAAEFARSVKQENTLIARSLTRVVIVRVVDMLMSHLHQTAKGVHMEDLAKLVGV